MFKIFGVNFLKTRNFGMARLCLKATIMIFFSSPSSYLYISLCIYLYTSFSLFISPSFSSFFLLVSRFIYLPPTHSPLSHSPSFFLLIILSLSSLLLFSCSLSPSSLVPSSSFSHLPLSLCLCPPSLSSSLSPFDSLPLSLCFFFLCLVLSRSPNTLRCKFNFLLRVLGDYFVGFFSLRSILRTRFVFKLSCAIAFPF